MARILTGIQNSGRIHLGNILGAVKPGIALARTEQEPAYFFIADLHTLTSQRDAQLNHEHMLNAAAGWLACGLNPEKEVFYRQSDVPEVAELTWYLSCFTPFPMLANAHAFKDKSGNLPSVNAGLFTYPVLMTADIILYDAHYVPVGKDQQQHLEIARDIAGAVNHQLGEEIFVLPEAIVNEEVKVIPGTDGRKMSKSYGNTVDIFQPDKKLRKNIMKIVTDSTPVGAPKDPDSDNVFALYKTMASPEQTQALREAYLAGGMGYGDAKQQLYELVVARFADERRRFEELMQAPEEIERVLLQGAEKARAVASNTLQRVRKALGFRPTPNYASLMERYYTQYVDARQSLEAEHKALVEVITSKGQATKADLAQVRKDYGRVS